MSTEQATSEKAADKLLGSIYEGTTDKSFPEAKFFLKRYNAKTGDVEYVGFLPEKFDVEYIKANYGGGKFYIDARVQGHYVAQTDIIIGGRSHPEPTRSDQPGVQDTEDTTRVNRLAASGEDELDRSLAKVVKYNAIINLVHPPGKNGSGNGNGQDLDVKDVLTKMLLKNLDKDPIKELTAAAGQINSLKDLFGKNKSRGAAQVTFESAFAESLPEIIDLIKEKLKDDRAIEVSSSSSNNKKLKAGNNDMVFVIKKLYQMAQAGESPQKGAALVLSVLSKENIKNLAASTPSSIAKEISKSFPDMKPFLTSEDGIKWLTEFHTILRQNITSRKVSPGQKEKSSSSGPSSEKGGKIQKSSGPQKISSGIPRSGTKKLRQGQSTAG